MEKEHQPDSMATITMKPDYPPSEVYSASEPPPAYRQRVSSSVQIARIAAFTIVASSLILGSFILASSWVSARASCQQLDQLDAMLDKELALEGRAYGNDALLPNEPLPLSAHALHADPPQDTLVAPEATVPVSKPVSEAQSQVKKDILNQAETKIDENKLQKVDDSKSEKTNSDSDESSDSDSSTEEEDDIDAMRPMFKLPIQFDLDELAGAFLANSQKGRMNCVVEKRHEDPMERQFPFNILGAFAPRGPQTERIAIICHGGDESRPVVPEPQSQVFAFPLSGPVRLPIRPHPDRDGPAPNNGPVSPFAALGQNRPMPFPLPMPWDSSEEQMTPPREMRIHVQRVIAIPAPHNMPPQPESMGPFSPPQAIDQNEQSGGAIIHQFVPQPAPTQELEQPQEQQKVATEQIGLPWGLTPEDLQNIIHRATEDSAAALASQNREQQIDNDMQEVKTIVNTLAAAAAEEAAAEAQSRVEQQKSDEVQAQPLMMHPAEQSPRQARTLLLPQDMGMDERPHYVQPRSVRSVDSLLHREKRMKRCACECA